MIRAIALALCLVGCIETREWLAGGGTYFRDARTDLCFAYWTTWSKGGSREVVTNVPCTDKVMKLIR